MNDKIDSNKKKDIHDFTNRSRIIVLDEHYFDGSWEKSEEGKRKLAELKEWLKDKELGDYSNPGPIINKIYLSKRYLKWEDLEFSYGEWKYQEVKLNGTKYTIKYKGDFDFFDNYYEVIKIYNQNERKQLFKLYNNKQFFNDLRLERVE